MLFHFGGQSQTLLFSENFESTTLPDSVNHSGNGNWGKSSMLYSQGSWSDSLKINGVSDSTVATTYSFSTTGNSFVMLYFDHICKIEFFDEGYIEVSNNNGTTWTRLTGAQYQGMSQFATQGNKFTAASYAIDWAAGSAVAPSNAWWKSEVFDISLLVGNAPNVLIRFILKDATPGNTMPDNYAWFIDNIRVIGAFSELNPPVITMIPPVPQDTVYTTTPYVIKANITDASGIDTAYVVYNVNTGPNDTIGMVETTPGNYQCSIPFFGYGRTIYYKVLAIDNSAAQNIAYDPPTGTRMIYSKYSPGGSVTIGTGTTASSTVGPTYISGTTSTYLWSNHISMFTPAEIGFVGPLSKISWYKGDAQGYNLGNATYRIYLKHTNASSVATAVGTFATELAGATMVYENTTQNLQLADGWMDFVLTNPNAFVYDGVSNLMVLVYWYRPGTPTGAVTWRYTTATGMACTWSSATDPPNITYGSGSRPNITMTFVTPSNLTSDAGIGQIVNPTGGVIANSPFNVIARVKNFGTDTLISTTVNWTLDGVLQTSYSWTGSVLQDSLSSNFTLGTVSLPLGVHEIKIWTVNPNGVPDMNFGNDTMSISFMACASLLSGTYTIGGVNPDFATFSAAMIALDQCGIMAPVTFNVASGTYNEQVVVPFISGASALNPVIFQSATGDSTDVVLQYNSTNAVTNYTLKLHNTSWVTFRKITIEAMNTTNGRAIEITGATNNVTFSNNRLVGVVNSVKSTNAQRAVVFSGGDKNDNMMFDKNLIVNGEHGLWMKGEGVLQETGTTVTNNTFQGQIMTALTLTDHTAPLLKGNYVNSTNLVDVYRGLYLVNCTGAIQVLANNVVIQNAVSAHGIELASSVSDPLNKGLVANNMVSVNLNITAANSMYPCGLIAYNSSNQRFFYNSVNIYGSSTIANSAFRFFNNTNNNGIELLNNNFVNTVSGGVVLNFEGVTSSAFTSNYNNLYSEDGPVGFLLANNATMADWQSASNGDLNSFAIKPYFNSNTDLHTFNGILNGLATPIAAVTTDFDGDPRNPVNPDPGADEFDPPATDVALLEILSPVGGCRMTATEPVTLMIRNTGTNAVTSGLSASYRFNGSPTVVTENITASINPGDTIIHTFATTVNIDVYTLGVADTFDLEAWTSWLSDMVPYNDSIAVVVPSLYTPLPPTVTDTLIPYGTSVTLTALSPDTVTWYTSDTASVEVHVGAVYATPPIFGNTTYWVAASTGSVQSSGPYTPGPNIAPLSIVSASNCSTGPCSAFNDLNLGVCGTQLVWVSTSNPPDPTPHVNFIDFEWNTPVTIDGLTIHHAQTTLRILTGATLYKWDAGAWVSFHNFTNLPIQCENTVPFPLTTTTKLRITSFLMQGPGQTSNPNFREIEVHEGKAVGCESIRVPLNVTVGPRPANDAGIDAVVSPAITAVSGSPLPVIVRLKNFGSDTLQQVKIYWSLNQVLQDSVMWTGSLLQDSTEVLTIDSVTLAGGNYCIDAWTSMPNGLLDSVPANDLATSCFNACMAGTFSIGPASAGSFQFNTFNDAMNTLIAAGICGHVVFEVHPGIYTEQLVLPQVTGMDTNQTVTFRGYSADSTAAILQWTGTSTVDYYTLRFNGGDYFRFERLTIRGLGTTNARPVEFMAASNFNIISNCVISVPAGTVSTLSPIYATSTSNSHSNQFLNNRILNGYYGMYYYGPSSTTPIPGMVLSGNHFEGFYYYGALMYYFDSPIITSNRFVNGTNSGICYGLSAMYFQNAAVITGNYIRISGTSTQYALRDYYSTSAASAPGIVANNMVIVSGASTKYGLYTYYSSNRHYYYNSVYAEGAGTVYTFYHTNNTTNTGIVVVNNIFHHNGSSYAYYDGTVGPIVTSDYNNLYNNSGNLAYYGGVAQPTLAALRTASGMNLNSHNLLPTYVSSNDLHQANSTLSGKGTWVPLVTVDFDGDPRSPIPTIGADEFPLLPNDAGVLAITAPGAQTFEGQSIPVTVTVANFGTNAISSMDIEYSINAGSPVVYSWTGNLATGNTASVTLPTFISPAGSYTLCAKTVLQGDSNTFNDQVCKTVFGNPANDAAVTRIVGLANDCNVGLDTISIWVKNMGGNAINSPSPSTVSVNYRIKPTATVVTETFTPVLMSGDSVLFHFSTLADFTVTTTTDTFPVKAWVDLLNDNVQYNDTAYFDIISYHVPAPPVVTDTTIPYGSSVTLFAQSPDSVLWYASQTATNEIGAGPYYTTPILYANTTYWAQAGASSAPAAPSSITTTFVAGNGQSGNMFDIIATSNINIDSFDINCTTSGLVEVWYRQGTYVPHIATQTGWTLLGSYSVSTNGTGNPTRFPVGGLTIPAGQTYGMYITYATGSGMQYTNGNGSNEIYTNSDMTIQTGHGGGYFNMTFSPRVFNGTIYYHTGGGTGCASTRVPVNVTVGNPVACDVGVYKIVEPVSAVNLGSQETVRIRVLNYGTATQTAIPVSFRVGNGPITTETLAGPILTGDSADYIFAAKANLGVPGNTYQLKAWTSLSCDQTQQNDTIFQQITNLLPNYCSSTATSALNQEITNVSVSNLNHTSPANGAMYTNHSLTVPAPMLSPGVNYQMSITSSFAPGSSTSNLCWIKVWIDLDRNGVLDATNELVLSQSTTSNNTITANIQIPANALVGTTMMRIVLNQTSSAAAVLPCGTYTYGETEDYAVTISPQAACDAGVISIISPTGTAQAGTPQPVWIKFRNFGSSAIASGNLSVAYRLNGGTPVVMAYPGSLGTMAEDSLMLPSVILPNGNNTICAYTILACDSVALNNEICRGIYGEYYASLPFFDDFETSNLWYKPATSVNWQYGTPAANIINTAFSGTKAWVTNLTGDYTNNADDYLYTPVFNFNGFGANDTITLSFYHWLAMAASDYGQVQYNLNGGAGWANLGFFGDPYGTNWYNTQVGGVHYFSQSNTGWIYSAYKLNPQTFNGVDTVQFRFRLNSNASGTSNGWAIDNFRLALPAVPDDIGVIAIVAPLNDTAAGSTVNATVLIRNFGTNPQFMFPIELKVNGNSISTELWTGNLAPQATTSYTFVLPFQAPNTAWQLCARTILSGDAFAMNDEVCKSYSAAPAYHDVGIDAILEPPTDSLGRICFHISVAPWAYVYDAKVRIINYGLNTQTSIPVKYTFSNGGTVYTDTWTGNLASLDTVIFTLSNHFKPLLGAQQLCAESDLIGDQVSSNNKTCKSYVGIVCPIGIEDQDGSGFILYQNVPNPATSLTTIGYRLPGGGDVAFGLVNLIGQVLITQTLRSVAGDNQIHLDVSSLSNGIYYYFVEFEGQRRTKKLVISN
jgi:hypothetical protein